MNTMYIIPTYNFPTYDFGAMIAEDTGVTTLNRPNIHSVKNTGKIYCLLKKILSFGRRSR